MANAGHTTSQDLHHHALHGHTSQWRPYDFHHTTRQTMFPRLQPQLLQTSLAQGFAPQWLQGKVLAKINLFSHAWQRYRLVQIVYGRVRVSVKLQCRGPSDHCVMASAHYFHLCCAAGGFLWPMLIFLCQSRFHWQGTEIHVREVLPPKGTCFSSFVCHRSVVPLTLKKLQYWARLDAPSGHSCP